MSKVSLSLPLSSLFEGKPQIQTVIWHGERAYLVRFLAVKLASAQNSLLVYMFMA